MRAHFSIITSLICFFSSLTAIAQDSPVDIKLYLFSMDEMEIRQVLRDGITRNEMSSLQNEMYMQNRLLEDEEPVLLKAGDNNIEIPAEKISALNTGSSTVVFFFEVMPSDGTDELSAGTFSRMSYVVTEKEEKVLPREGEWKYPAMLPSYRYFDFRYANVLGHVDFIYELTAEFDGSPVLYKISVK